MLLELQHFEYVVSHLLFKIMLYKTQQKLNTIIVDFCAYV